MESLFRFKKRVLTSLTRGRFFFQNGISIWVIIHPRLKILYGYMIVSGLTFFYFLAHILNILHNIHIIVCLGNFGEERRYHSYIYCTWQSLNSYLPDSYYSYSYFFDSYFPVSIHIFIWIGKIWIEKIWIWKIWIGKIWIERQSTYSLQS